MLNDHVYSSKDNSSTYNQNNNEDNNEGNEDNVNDNSNDEYNIIIIYPQPH